MRTNTHGHGTTRTRAAHSRLQQGLQRGVRLGVRARRLRREPMCLENLVDGAPLSHVEGGEHTGAVLGWGSGGEKPGQAPGGQRPRGGYIDNMMHKDAQRLMDKPRSDIRIMCT